MATKKTRRKASGARDDSRRDAKHARASAGSTSQRGSRANVTKSSSRATVSGPSVEPGTARRSANDLLGAKAAGTAELAASFPFNRAKAAEHSRKGAPQAPAGATSEPSDASVTASTLTEMHAAPKAGGPAAAGINPTVGPLDRVRVDSGGQPLTTNQGVAVADNQNSLKAGLRGPALLEDFTLREKITHFDHERIPERVVHARGSGAHGFFECYTPLTQYTRASLFAEAGKRTPVFVRFSTVAGERGSADTVRDVRGFAVKFYTDEGNWDLVGNNIPVFFIQDAMKFPDVIHAVKPEPHFAMPQASSAHDTFWDFVSLMPESTHMLLWVMSDRAVPRSYRMMQGFGVHTFRFVNDAGESVFVKFHWSPVAGTHSLDWDEAVKIAGADADFHRRDLWEAIEAGAYPEYELGVQIFTEEQADAFTFDVLDPTKIVPEELVPLTPVGRMVLNRNPDNFFAETEQVAFCTAHIVPGIDFSNDPLLAGRIHSYVDTQITRLGGPNFHEIPINAPVAQVHNNQRDGMHRQAIHRGRVAYEPNSLGGGCPFQAGIQHGFQTFPQRLREPDKVRGKPEKFADHYTQATLFWNSQSPTEKAHIIRGFRFELTRVQTPPIRERLVSMLANVADELAGGVAEGLGFPVPPPMPRVLEKVPRPEVTVSSALSLFARPGDGSVRTRRIAILVADGFDPGVEALHTLLAGAGAVPRFVGVRLGPVKATANGTLNVEVTLEAAPSVLWDAVVLPAGAAAAEALAREGQVLEFLKDQYRHCKPILMLGESSELLARAALPATLADGTPDPGLLAFDVKEPADLAKAAAAFLAVLGRHRVFSRETDPPRI